MNRLGEKIFILRYYISNKYSSPKQFLGFDMYLLTAHLFYSDPIAAQTLTTQLVLESQYKPDLRGLKL